MTWGGCELSEGSFSEDPAMTVYQKLEALNQTNDSLQGTFARKADWTKGMLNDTMLPAPPGQMKDLERRKR